MDRLPSRIINCHTFDYKKIGESITILGQEIIKEGKTLARNEGRFWEYTEYRKTLIEVVK